MNVVMDQVLSVKPDGAMLCRKLFVKLCVRCTHFLALRCTAQENGLFWHCSQLHVPEIIHNVCYSDSYLCLKQTCSFVVYD
jgi:hypothetical protein